MSALLLMMPAVQTLECLPMRLKSYPWAIAYALRLYHAQHALNCEQC